MLMNESTTPGDLFSGTVNIGWKEGSPVSVGLQNHTAVWLNGLVYVLITKFILQVSKIFLILSYRSLVIHQSTCTY